VRFDSLAFGLLVTLFALSACDNTTPIAPLPEDAASDAPTDARPSRDAGPDAAAEASTDGAAD
jgi:hypothetical protein